MPVGKTKFYNPDRGFGFIHDQESGNDVYFRIREVEGAVAPSGGDTVSFEISNKNGRSYATNISILESYKAEKSKRNLKSLDGFPCIRGNSISGFFVFKDFGYLSVGTGIFYTYYSVNGARQALINAAKKTGANAIINFVWHRERRTSGYSTKKWFGPGYNYHYTNDDYFWCEGNAVHLQSK